MKNRLATILLLASLGALPTITAAQTPTNSPVPENRGNRQPGPMRGPMLNDLLSNSEVAAKLQLSATQRTQLEKIFADHRDIYVTTRDQMRSAQEAVHQALNTDPVNESAYNIAVANAQALHAKLGAEFAAMTLSFRKVLTLEQWKALEAMQHDARGHRDFDNHGKKQDQNQPK